MAEEAEAAPAPEAEPEAGEAGAGGEEVDKGDDADEDAEEAQPSASRPQTAPAGEATLDEKIQAENAKWSMHEDFFYSDDDPELVPPVEAAELPHEAVKPMRFMGFDFTRHQNLVYTSEDEFAYITGHVICVVNLRTGERRNIHGRDSGGVGAIAMSPDMQYIAVAEKSMTTQPNVYIYLYSSMRLYRILRKGTTSGYAAVQFSPHNKSHMATLGMSPDYLLSIWDWKSERLLLKCKAYGQDIFSIRWGQFPGMLFSAGVGHIRFWKMAATFTGLKLQGDLGKFGATELSDIIGYVELPDGKIVTGSEYGKLLLWEGVFVKVELMLRNASDGPRQLAGPAHKGAVNVVFLDSGSTIVSGGDDGFLRWWPIAEIDEAEADYDNGILEYGIAMKKEVRIPTLGEEHGMPFAANIQHVARSPDGRTWLIQDNRNGVVWRYEVESGSCSLMVQTHAGPVTGTLVMHNFPGLVISSGADGTLRGYNMSTEGGGELFIDRRGGNVGITCLTATPAIVDPERRTVCCGYADGTVRALSVCRDGFVLLQAQKPHNCPVRQVAYSPEGSFLATLGTDNTIFFFEIRSLEDHAVPLGFVQVPSQVQHLNWHPENGRVLLSLENGTALELARPLPDAIDNTESFQFPLDFRAVRPEVPEPEESEDEDAEDEAEEGGAEGEGAPETPEERKERRRRERAEREAAAKEEEEDGGGGAAAAPEASAVSHTVYFTRDGAEVVLFVGTGRYSGALWEFSMDSVPTTYHSEVALGEHEPAQVACTLQTKLPKGVPVSYMSIPSSGRFLHIGFADGRLWILPLHNLSCYSCVNLADSTHGRVNTIDTDNDSNMMVVGAGDGTLSMVMFNSEAAADLAEAKLKDAEPNPAEVIAQITGTMPELPETDPDTWEMPDTESPGYAVIARDITDPKHYSIQDQKLKSEEDNAKAQAEQKKRRVRDRIAEIRAELEELHDKNAHLPANKLANEEMIVDQEYITFLTEDMEDRVEEVKAELAWSVEYHERGMQKLRDYYLARLDFERIEVRGFQSPHRVSTFRCPSMSAELQASLARLHELIFAADRESDDEEGGLAEPGSPGGRANGAGGKSSLAGKGEGADGGASEAGAGQTAKAATSGAEQRELRRQQRNQRRQQMAELEKAKPSDSYEDPQDVEAIAQAEATLGNYMLKTSDSYQVPENQRMNAEKKRRQMFLLEESMHAIKTEFNHRVLALRDFRQQVRTEVDRDLAALREIDHQLGTNSPWVDGLLDDEPGAPLEFPDHRFQYTEQDLKVFGRQLKEASGGKVTPEGQGEDEPNEAESDEEGEDGGDNDDEDEFEKDEEEEAASGIDSRRHSSSSAPKRKGKKAKAAAAAKEEQPAVAGRSALSSRRVARLTLRAQLLQERGNAAGPVGKAVLEEAVARLRHDKVQLEEHIRQIIDTFNNAVASIEKEKAKLESDLKNADLKLLVLYEELLTLNELEEKDEALLRKATKCRQDKTSIMHQIKECQDQLGERKAEIEQWHSEEQNLQAEFTELVGENSPFLGALLKIYKKKVKRSKRKKGLGEEEDFDEDEDEDEEDSDLESDEDEDEMDEDVGPPQGCDVQIYDGVVDLREKRLDMEDALQEIQKAVEELKKQHKKLLDDERRIDKEQKQTDAEIQHFQTDKQRKLNQVEIVFALRLSQVQCLEQGEQAEPERLPTELDHHVVFTREGLARLMSRITELHQEIREVKASHKQLQRDFRLRKKEKNQKMQNIEDLQAKFQDIQMLKFGQIVDLDLIERSAPNKYVQELQEKVGEAEAEHRRRLAEWEKKIEKQKRDLAKVTCDNTSLMEQIVSMGYSQMQLDAALNARIANVTVNDTEPLVELREMERERLKDLLALQSKEIATLQAEISLFRKKGGHIYTTVTANRGTDKR